ncbi:MAG: hypothetical protein ACRCWO_08150 [Bosea sp. (in: a-proteobacteria)]
MHVFLRPVLRPMIGLMLVSSGLGANIASSLAQGFSQQPAVQPSPGTLVPMGQGQLAISAIFAAGNQPVRSGVVWRILAEKPEGPQVVARSTDPAPVLTLEAGSYVVHAAYGYASAIRRVTIQPGRATTERVPISAGALRLAGTVGDQPIAPTRISFSIFVPLPGNSEGRLIAQNLKPTDLVRLPEGTYHVVSTYGDANAIQRADIKVESAKVTEATLHHRAARVTLKLVAQAGGEAFAGTAFSVLTPGGDVIREAIGAFPQVILAEGEYVLIARQDGQVYSRDFKVEAGLDRDIEVLAKAN